jgi:hypothetical protein
MFLFLPLLIASNAFLFLCLVGLGIVGIGGERAGILAWGNETNERIVRDYLAERIPSDRYRIVQFYPVASLDGDVADDTGERSATTGDRGFVQGVKLAFYGPGGARQLDTVYWIQNGKVTRTMVAELAAMDKDSSR